MANYLHDCLELHPQVALVRYGKAQDLYFVEQSVQRVLDDDIDLWRVICHIAESDHFHADIFGPLADLERTLREQDWYAGWRDLSDDELPEKLYSVYRQIEPVSMVLRFIKPERFGIFSAPVASVLGLRMRSRQVELYKAYLKTLRELLRKRGFRRIADVEMALWALQVGVVEHLLKGPKRDDLFDEYKADRELRRMQARDLTADLFNEWPRLHLADALRDDHPDLAGQIAGIRFERLVRKWLGYSRSLEDDINGSPASKRDKARLDRARRIRNRAIHEHGKVTRRDIDYLIDVARWVRDQARKRRKK